MIRKFLGRNFREFAGFKRMYSEALKTEVISDLNARPLSPLVQELASKIVALNMLEVADLVKVLKKELNITESMMMPVGNVTAQPNAVTDNKTVEPAVAKEAEKTEFKVTLEKYDAAGKAKIIREIKAILPNLNLVEAKNFVEGVPKVIKEKVKKEEAEKIKKTIEELGGSVKLE